MHGRALMTLSLAAFAFGASAEPPPTPRPGWPSTGRLFVGTCYQPVDRSPEEVRKDIGLIPVVRVSLEVIQLDAVVTDSEDRYVRDLQPEDFEVVEEGRPQEINAFAYIHLRRVLSPTTAPPPPGSIPLADAATGAEPASRTIAFVIDDLSMQVENMISVCRAPG